MLFPALALSLLTAPPALCCAQGTAIQDGLEQVRKQMEKRQWDRAYTDLRALFDKHEGSEEMMMESDSIRVDMKRIVFWRTHQEPDPATLVSGKLLKYKDGKIEIVYDYEALDADWDGTLASFHWQALFAGPYSVTLKIRNYPNEQPIHASIGAGEDAWVRVSLGLKNPISGNSQFYPAAIDLMPRDGDEEALDRNDNIQVMSGVATEFKIGVTASKIQVHHAGKKILDAKRPKGAYGQFGLFGFTKESDVQGLTVEIAGEIEPMWLQNKADAAMETVRAEFDIIYEEKDHLPAWLLAGPTAAEPVVDAPPQRPYPGPELTGDLRDAYRVAIDHLKYLGDEEGLESQLAHVDELAGGGELSAALLAFLRMRVHEEAGRFEPALKHADEVIAAFPGSIEAIEECLWYLIERNDISRANAVARSAAFASAESAARLEWLRKILLMADKGPAFERSFEYTSEHYVVRSDLSRELCAETARLLESAYTSYSVHLRRASRASNNKFRVYLFSGEASYARYAEEAFGGRMESTAGVYSPLVKQLLIWNLPDADERRHTVIHEGFHQYFDALTEETPRWLNEGIAQYYELADTVNGKFTTGQVDARQLRYLAENGIAPLAEFFQLTAAEFMDAVTVTRNYAQAWAFAHYLQHSGKPRAAIYEALFNGLCDGMSADGAVRAAFADVDLDALESGFLEYLDGLSVD